MQFGIADVGFVPYNSDADDVVIDTDGSGYNFVPGV